MTTLEIILLVCLAPIAAIFYLAFAVVLYGFIAWRQWREGIDDDRVV